MKIRLNSLTFNRDANLAKVGVASSSLVFRSKQKDTDGCPFCFEDTDGLPRDPNLPFQGSGV